jgi:hypothetical protein
MYNMTVYNLVVYNLDDDNKTEHQAPSHIHEYATMYTTCERALYDLSIQL